MPTGEYHSEFLYANVDIKGVKEDLAARWPDWKPGKRSPETLIPGLNQRGAAG